MTGLRVLIVEDEALIAMLAEDMIDSLGATVVGSAATLADAQAKIADCDCVLLDLNLGQESTVPLAEALQDQGKPFVFTTGSAEGIDGRFAGVPVLVKPYQLRDLERVLAAFA